MVLLQFDFFSCLVSDSFCIQTNLFSIHYDKMAHLLKKIYIKLVLVESSNKLLNYF